MGKKHFMYVIVFVSYLTLFYPLSSVAGEIPCPKNLSQFAFFNSGFIATSGDKKAFCASGAYKKGSKLCDSVRTGYTTVNPNNKQYIIYDEYDENDKQTASADLAGVKSFVFCVPDIPENSKSNKCNEAKEAAEDPGFTDITYTFRWLPFKDGRDGNCGCRPKGSTGNFSLNCEDAIAQLPITVNGERRNSGNDEPAPVVAPAATVDEPVAVSAAVPVSTEPDPAFKNCVDIIVSSANSCVDDGGKAKTSCNASNTQSADSGNGLNVGQILGAVLDSKSASKAGSGAQSTCFMTGLAANGARELFKDSNSNCKSSTSTCDNSCADENKQTELEQRCARMVGMSPEDLRNPAITTPNANYFRAQVTNDIATKFTAGRRDCQQGKRDSSTLEAAIQGTGNALQQSMQCACQLSGTSGATTSSIGGCSNIPTAAACEANPSAAGCELYSQMSVCTPGASYNAESCRCQTNPKAAGCPGVKTDTMLSSFAGGAIKAGAVAGPTGFGMPAGFQSSGNTGDLGTGADPSNAGVISSGKSAGLGNVLPSVTSGSGGGSTGGGGYGGGGEKNNTAALDREDKGLFGGILSAGRFIGNALGIKSKKTDGSVLAAKKNANAKKAPRGLASSKTFASKHGTIWELMNKCVQGETCQSNVGQFIVEPEK